MSIASYDTLISVKIGYCDYFALVPKWVTSSGGSHNILFLLYVVQGENDRRVSFTAKTRHGREPSLPLHRVSGAEENRC